MNTTHITSKEVSEIETELEKVKKVDVSELYVMDDRINSTEIARFLLEKFDSIEAVLMMPSDAGVDNPPAYLISKVSVGNAVEYVKRKATENKIVAISDPFETDYVIFA